MQIVSLGDNLHEMSKSVFWKKKIVKYNPFVVSDIVQRVEKINLCTQFTYVSIKMQRLLSCYFDIMFLLLLLSLLLLLLLLLFYLFICFLKSSFGN